MIITTVCRTSDNSILNTIGTRRETFEPQSFPSYPRAIISVILVCLQRNIENNWPQGRQERNFTSIIRN